MSRQFWSGDISPWWLLPFGIAAIVAVFHAFAPWLESHPGIASWIQAIGIPFSIAAAIYVAWRDNKNQMDRKALNRRERADGIRELVAVDYLDFRMQVELLYQRLEHDRYDVSTPRMPYSNMLNMLKLTIPEMFNDALMLAIDADRDALKPCTDMIHAAAMHNNYIGQFGAVLLITPDQWISTLATIKSGLERVRVLRAHAWPFFEPDQPDPVPDILAQMGKQEE